MNVDLIISRRKLNLLEFRYLTQFFKTFKFNDLILPFITRESTGDKHKYRLFHIYSVGQPGYSYLYVGKTKADEDFFLTLKKFEEALFELAGWTLRVNLGRLEDTGEIKDGSEIFLRDSELLRDLKNNDLSIQVYRTYR